jgi:hypothetical protein
VSCMRGAFPSQADSIGDERTVRVPVA